MSIPQLNFTGQEFEVTMMELRKNPGEVFDRVSRGAIIHVTKSGKRIADIIPCETVIHSDGSYSGARPLTMGLKL